MGREAECDCRWGAETGHCKVLLEGSELIMRGAIRHRVPFSSMADVAVQGDELRFKTDGVPVALALGTSVAKKWAEIIATLPPGLAKKLGITHSSHVLVVGDVDAAELKTALAEAGSVNRDEANLVLVRASTSLELEARLGACWSRIEAGCPVWIVYPKGKTSTLGETAVRDKMRGLGCIDTKVASVSAELTGLRFIQRNGS